MSKAKEGFLRVILTMVVALAIGALLIIGIGENPIEAYGALLNGAFNGKFRLGTTLAGFTPLLLTSTAFAIAAKAGAFNVGVEGEVFLGGIVAAYIGINWTFLPKPLLVLQCGKDAFIAFFMKTQLHFAILPILQSSFLHL